MSEAATETTTGVVSTGRRLTDLAELRGDEAAIVFVPEQGDHRAISWRELEATANRQARLLAQHGVAPGSFVGIALPNRPEHVSVVYAIWKLGACPLPLSARLPPRERERVLEAAKAAALVSEWAVPGEIGLDALAAAEDLDASPLPDVIAAPGKAIASGGSTGTPKIIVDPRPQARVPNRDGSVIMNLTGLRPGQTQLVAGPLYHNGPFGACFYGMFEGHDIVLMERFDALRVLELIERYRVNWAYLVPTMMRRILQQPHVHAADLSSLDAIYHTAQACPPTVKRAWIELLGSERVYEAYGATEEIGLCAIRGDEWLEHPGSVGRPLDSELRILDEHGSPCPNGVVGEVFMRRLSGPAPFEYRGSDPPASDADGFQSVGDLGWVDDDGYLHLTDRRVDMIVTGGANVYPAEVEAALLEHPQVADVTVVGLPDPEWGRRVHAIVQPRDETRPPSPDDLRSFCREYLLTYKIPKTYEFTARLPRDEAGKVRRRQLVEERTPADGQPGEAT